jgi:hypothetical protein
MNKARGLLGMKRVVTIVVLLAMTIMLMAASHTYQLAAPKITERGDYSYIELNQGQLIGEPGTPALPYIGAKILLPLGMEATDIRIERKNPTSYTLSKQIAPMQAQYPFMQSDLPPMALPDQDVYGSDSLYPSQIHNGFRTEFLAGHSIAFSAICPFSYNPQANELVFYSTIQIMQPGKELPQHRTCLNKIVSLMNALANRLITTLNYLIITIALWAMNT